jgi:hypothetical protein
MRSVLFLLYSTFYRKEQLPCSLQDIRIRHTRTQTPLREYEYGPCYYSVVKFDGTVVVPNGSRERERERELHSYS